MSLIAIKGITNREDVILNVAGVLAVIVAFVPTSEPSTLCSEREIDTLVVAPAASADDDGARDREALSGAIGQDAYIENNILAFVIGGLVAIAIPFGV